MLSGVGVLVRKDIAGYEGSGFVGSFTTAGDKLTLSFPNLAAGSYNVRIRYHAWGNQQNNVVIDGVSRSEVFPATGSGWAVKTISNVTFAAGTHTVAITKDWGYIDVDSIELVSASAGTPALVGRVAIKTQAESGAVAGTGVGIRSNLAGFEGTGFVGSFTASRDMLTLGFPNVVAGTYSVRIRYHAWTAQQNAVIVNGISRTESFPATGSGWAVKTLTGVTLSGGTNSVSVLKDWGYIDVDWIEIAP